jgi:hypothetical protein
MTANGLIVRKIDHVYVALADPAAAVTFLTSSLGLPVAWPLTQYSGFSSAGVGLGNVNFEVIESNSLMPSLTATSPARISGIAFEPERIDQAFLDELDRREIPHTPPLTSKGTSPEVIAGSGWTNVLFGGLMSRASVFVCEYQDTDLVDVAARQEALDVLGGGALGIERAEEIVIGSPHSSAATARWQRLFDPLQPQRSGHWRPGVGPALRIVASDQDVVERLSLRVQSRGAAQRALSALAVDINAVGDEICVHPAALCGLELRFIATGP